MEKNHPEIYDFPTKNTVLNFRTGMNKKILEDIYCRLQTSTSQQGRTMPLMTFR